MAQVTADKPRDKLSEEEISKQTENANLAKGHVEYSEEKQKDIRSRRKTSLGRASAWRKAVCFHDSCVVSRQRSKPRSSNNMETLKGRSCGQ